MPRKSGRAVSPRPSESVCHDSPPIEALHEAIDALYLAKLQALENLARDAFLEQQAWSRAAEAAGAEHRPPRADARLLTLAARTAQERIKCLRKSMKTKSAARDSATKVAPATEIVGNALYSTTKNHSNLLGIQQLQPDSTRCNRLPSP